MGYLSRYSPLYPSQWSEWDWNVQHACYVRYRLVGKNDYEWDYHQPEPEFTEEYYSEQYSDYYSEQSSKDTSSYGSTSSFPDTSSQQSDRDSGYGSTGSSQGFDDLLDHPESWAVNPFLAFGFPPAKNSSTRHNQKRKQHSKSQSGLDISRTSLHSDEGFSEPSHSWITLFGKHKKEVNLMPTVDYQSQVCYVSHSVLKDLGIWDSRRMGKGKEDWIPGTEEGTEDRIKVIGSWTVSWLSTFKETGRGTRMQRTTFKVFRDKKRRIVMGMSPREAKKFGIR